MAQLVTVLASGLVPKLGAERSIDGGIKAWLRHGVYQPNPASTASNIILDNVSSTELSRYTAFDLERFALSSWESYSLASTELDSKNLVSWPLLKLYYSSFFAAHALMRGQGSGVINLESRQAVELNQILAIVSEDVSPNISAGMYLYQLATTSNGTRAVTLTPSPSSHGVHAGFWNQFHNFLTERANSASERGAADALLFVAGIEEVADAIGVRSGSKGAWLSSVRNEINYQHKHRVWHPVRRAQQVKELIKPLGVIASRSIRLDVSQTSKPIEAFANITKYLACLNYEMSDVVSKTSTVNGAFGQKWRRLVREFK